MDFWIFTHSMAPFDFWMEGYRERFDAWQDAGVRGIVVGYMNFVLPDGSSVRAWTPDPKTYTDRGETPPPVAPSDPQRERRFRAMLDDAVGRGWKVMIFGGSMSPASLQDQANAYPQVSGFVWDGPGENHYELAFHHGGELLEVRPGEEAQFAALGADLDRIGRGIASLRRGFHELTPDRVRYLAPGGTFAGLSLLDLDEDALYWLRQRRASSRRRWAQVRASIDAVDRKVDLGGIPRTAAFSSLTGQDYQQMGKVFDILFPKHYYWHRGFDGLYGTVARWVQRLLRWNPTLTEPDAFLVVESLFGLKLPGIRTLLDMETLGFPQAFYDEVVAGETRRALEAVGDPDRVVFWVSTGRAPHAGDAMTSRDLHCLLTAAREAGMAKFLFHPDPKLSVAEWRVLSSLCGTPFRDDPYGTGYWPGGSARGDAYTGGRKPSRQD